MTEEQQAAFDKMQQELEEARASVAQLEANQKSQNSYITKLESKVKEKTASYSSMDKDLALYIQRKRKEDVTNDALVAIRDAVPDEIVNLLLPELNRFLDKTMTIERTKESYVIDSFYLLYGKAMGNKDHAIHEIGKPAVTENPPASPPVEPQAPARQATPNSSQALKDKLKERMGPVVAPTMTPSDDNFMTAPPVQPAPITDTKSAISAWRAKLAAASQNRFS